MSAVSTSPNNSPLACSPATPVTPFSNFLSPMSGHCSGETIIFESSLHKTPPLKSFIMKWTKRWFVLSKLDPMDPTSVQLSYYKDNSKKEMCRVIDLSKFVGIRPSAKVGNHEHVFAIETEERKYILKAQDLHTKNIWLAKLCELFGQEQVCHVTIPNQPSCSYTEAILKLTCPTHVTAVVPSTGSVLVEILFNEVRRLGCSDAYGTNIIWFETCKHSVADNFYFFTVPSGRETAQEIVREFKAAIECYTSVLLIMEDCTGCELSFISRDHYGCPQFPGLSRKVIIQTGLSQLPTTWQTFLMHERLRRESESVSRRNSLDQAPGGGMSLDEWVAMKGRRKSGSVKSSASLTRRPTVDKFVRKASITSFDRDLSSPMLEHTIGHLSDSCEVFEPLPQPSTPTHSLNNSPRQCRPSLSCQTSTGSLTSSFPSPSAPHQRKLSYQSSVSSRSSTSSFHPHTAIKQTGSSTSVNSLDFEDTSIGHTFAYQTSDRVNAPVVPPRSVVSLQDTYAFSHHLTAAH